MSVFGDYAEYYDLLYQAKDYQGEVTYIQKLIADYAKESRSILELGCGTGKHALLLAERGLTVHGIDASQEMLQQATQLSGAASTEVKKRLTMDRGDVRTYRCGRKFDVVLSLFHVMSYQTGNNALREAFSTAAAHLEPGGIFIFDCWYGPAVLNERPEVRVKRLENETIQVIRIAEPDLRVNENRVDVNYHVFVKNKQNGSVSELRETHAMRYLFLPEIRELLSTADMEYLRSEEWITGNEPGEQTWGICLVARK